MVSVLCTLYSVLLNHRLVILDFECITNVVFLWICGYRLVLGANERYVGQFNVGIKREKTRESFFPRILNQGPLPEIFGTAGLKV
jgi:hypothetical protein